LKLSNFPNESIKTGYKVIKDNLLNIFKKGRPKVSLFRFANSATPKNVNAKFNYKPPLTQSSLAS
jgi:hypothetical protein